MPFKDFTVGQVLTSAEVDNFLMKQAVMVFDDESDRSTSLGTFVAEGMVTYLKDRNEIQVNDGTNFEPIQQPISPLLLLGV